MTLGELNKNLNGEFIVILKKWGTYGGYTLTIERSNQEIYKCLYSNPEVKFDNILQEYWEVLKKKI